MRSRAISYADAAKGSAVHVLLESWTMGEFYSLEERGKDADLRLSSTARTFDCSSRVSTRGGMVVIASTSNASQAACNAEKTIDMATAMA